MVPSIHVQAVEDAPEAQNLASNEDSASAIHADVELIGLDSELAPLPDPATWDTSVARRASVRLVSPPAVESSMDELPTVAGLQKELREESQVALAQPASRTTDTASNDIHQEAREQQSTAPAQQPPAVKETAKAGKSTPQTAPKAAANAKTSKGKKKDIDEMQAGCKCIIM